MKKLSILLEILTFVSISCTKECECETTINDSFVFTEIVVIDDGKCKDMNTFVSEDGYSAIVVCK